MIIVRGYLKKYLNQIYKILEFFFTSILSIAFLMIESVDAVNDEEFLLQFCKVEQMPSEKKQLVKELLDAFIFKSDLQRQ